MELSGLTEHLAAIEARDAITLPWKGAEYVILAPGVARRLRCAALLAAYVKPREDRAEAVRMVLGDDRIEDLTLGADVAQQMHDDDVPVPVMSYLATVALIAWVQGEAAAQRYIDTEAAGEQAPKAPPRSRASKTGTSTGAARTTKRRASTSGTTPRRSASPAATAARGRAAASTGGISSPAGTSS